MVCYHSMKSLCQYLYTVLLAFQHLTKFDFSHSLE